ncbi:lysozyme inhibitor LprI family protein [Sulfurovum sp.]|uniref:lysozyme inhibitor LprI family protein n=1 Tax=Sulfurovum sp. TaxID=1969726 RepID=UPI00260DD63C|nr:lysozyme inhibitor LprI family protein [Sulfurovum sp.]
MEIRSILSAGLVISVAAFANHPSFDCSKVKKDSSEGVICSSDKLMDLDRELASVYRKALAKASTGDRLKAEQRGWIKGRNDCWKAKDEKQCMIGEYKVRIKELKEKYQLSGDSSTAKHANTDSGTKYAFDKTLKLEGITFHVQATDSSSLNQLVITPSGLKEVNRVIGQEIDGSVTGAEVADLNGDGSPEIYIYVTSAGSGSYGTLVAYSANNKKSLSEIYLPPIGQNKKMAQGYMGHDEFSIVENTFVRRFPLYLKNDPNCCPKGGTRQLEYKLVPGEATWQLKLVKSRTF